MNRTLINSDLIDYINTIVKGVRGYKVTEDEVIKIIDIIPQNTLEIWEGHGCKCSVFNDQVYELVLKMYLNKL